MNSTMKLATVIPFVLALFAPALSGAADPATEPKPPFEMPARFTANYMAMSGPGPTRAGRVVLTLDRLSTRDERVALLRTLKDRGQDALIAEMEKGEVGRIQIDTRLAYPVRVASAFHTEKGWVVRAATDRNIDFAEATSMMRSKDYPVGVLELQLPDDGGPGEGGLFAATRVSFNESGRLEIESLPTNTGPQRLVSVYVEPVKAKKKK